MVRVRLVEATLVPKLDWYSRPSLYPKAQQSVSGQSSKVSPALLGPALPCIVSPCCAPALLCLAYNSLASLDSEQLEKRWH